MEACLAMSARELPSRRRRIGVALDERRLTASLVPNASGPSRGQRHELFVRELTGSSEGAGAWPDLAEAFAALRQSIGAPCELHVALMPPLAQLRIVELPGLSESEATRLVSRDPSRFVPMRGSPLAVALHPFGWRDSSRFTLLTAPAPLVGAIEDAAQASGCSLGSIIAAENAWATALAPTRWSRAIEDLVVSVDDAIVVLRLQRGQIAAVRRLPADAHDRSEAEVRGLLESRQIAIHTEARIIGSRREAAEVAAAHAARATRRAPRLLSERRRVAVARRGRRSVVTRFAMAAALFVLAGWIELWGLSRAHARIADERARIRLSVEHALAVRESVAVLRDRLARIHNTDSTAPHWSELIAAVADVLPSDAYLTSLTATADSLRLEGDATRAAPVFEALARVRGLTGVHPAQSIRQLMRDGNLSTEHFVLGATLSPRDLGSPSRILPIAGGQP